MDISNDKPLQNKLKEICKAVSSNGKEDAKDAYQLFYEEAQQLEKQPRFIHQFILEPRWEGYRLKDFVNSLINESSKEDGTNLLDIILKSTGKDLESFNNAFGDKGLPDSKAYKLFQGLAKHKKLSEPEITLLFLQFCEGKVLSIFFDKEDEEAEAQAIIRLSNFLAPYETIPTSPYKTLEAFTTEDENLFFGRDDEINAITEHLRTSRFLALIGSSGSGKSSLMFAGVIPDLLKKGWHVCNIRLATSEYENPIAELAYQLACAVVPEKQTERPIKLSEIRKNLIEEDEALTTWVNIAREQQKKNILIYIDQFEELFTSGFDDEDLSAFINVLKCFKSKPKSVPVSALIISVRADFTDYLDDHDLLRELSKGRNSMSIYSLTKDGLKEAIVRPALEKGSQFEEGLVDEILDDAVKSDTSLALIGFALDKLWYTQDSDRVLRFSSYNRIGKISKAFIESITPLIFGLPEEDITRLKRVIIKLIGENEGKWNVKRVALRTEFIDKEWFMIQRLANQEYRLLIIDKRNTDDIYTVELIHEALINDWPLIKELIQEHGAFLDWHRKFRVRKDEWFETPDEPSLLLSGSTLSLAQEMLEKYSNFLCGAEDEVFIQRSVLYEKKQQKKAEKIQKTIMSVALSTIALLSALSLSFYYAKNKAAEASLMELEQKIRAEKNIQKLIAIQAEDAAASFENSKAAQFALLNLSQSFSAPISEETRSKTIDVLRNLLGRYIEYRRLPVKPESIRTFELSPSGKYVAVFDRNNSISIWDIEHIDVVKSSVANSGTVKKMSFSMEEDKLAIIYSGGEIQILQIENGLSNNENSTIKIDKSRGEITNFKWFREGGSFLITSEESNLTYMDVYSILDKIEYKSIFNEAINVSCYDILKSDEVLFFKEGSFEIASLDDDFNVRNLVSTYKDLSRCKISNGLILLETKDGEVEISKFKSKNENLNFSFVSFLEEKIAFEKISYSKYHSQFSYVDHDDEKFILINDGNGELMDLTAEMTGIGIFEEEEFKYSDVGYVPDLMLFASNIKRDELDAFDLYFYEEEDLENRKFWDFREGYIFTLDGEYSKLFKRAEFPIGYKSFYLGDVKGDESTISPDLKHIAYVREDEDIKVVGINYGDIVRTIKTPIDYGSVTSIALNYDGSKLLAGYKSGKVVQWDVTKNSVINEFTLTYPIINLVYSDDFNKILGMGWNKQGYTGVYFEIDLITGVTEQGTEFYNNYYSQKSPQYSRSIHKITDKDIHFAKEKGGKYFKGGITRFLDTKMYAEARISRTEKNGKDIRSYVVHLENTKGKVFEIKIDNQIEYIEFSPNGESILVMTYGVKDNALLYSTQTGKLICEIEMIREKSFEINRFLPVFSESSKFITFVDGNKHIQINDAFTGELRFKYTSLLNPIVFHGVSEKNGLASWTEGSEKIILHPIKIINASNVVDYFASLKIPEFDDFRESHLENYK